MKKRDAILPLAQEFLFRYNATYPGRNLKGISTEAAQALYHYDWPLNIRELKNAVLAAAAKVQNSAVIEFRHLPEEVRLFGTSSGSFGPQRINVGKAQLGPNAHYAPVVMGSAETLADSLIEVVSGDPSNDGTMRTIERLSIQSAMRKKQDNRTHAADLLDISIRTLRNKLNEYSGKKRGPQKGGRPAGANGAADYAAQGTPDFAPPFEASKQEQPVELPPMPGALQHVLVPKAVERKFGDVLGDGRPDDLAVAPEKGLVLADDAVALRGGVASGLDAGQTSGAPDFSPASTVDLPPKAKREVEVVNFLIQAIEFMPPRAKGSLWSNFHRAGFSAVIQLLKPSVKQTESLLNISDQRWREYRYWKTSDQTREFLMQAVRAAVADQQPIDFEYFVRLINRALLVHFIERAQLPGKLEMSAHARRETHNDIEGVRLTLSFRGRINMADWRYWLDNSAEGGWIGVGLEDSPVAGSDVAKKGAPKAREPNQMHLPSSSSVLLGTIKTAFDEGWAARFMPEINRALIVLSRAMGLEEVDRERILKGLGGKGRWLLKEQFGESSLDRGQESNIPAPIRDLVSGWLRERYTRRQIYELVEKEIVLEALRRLGDERGTLKEAQALSGFNLSKFSNIVRRYPAEVQMARCSQGRCDTEQPLAQR